MSFLGLDPQSARTLAARMSATAEALDSHQQSLTAALRSLTWNGRDSSTFHSDWHNTLQPTLRRVAEDMRRYSQRLTQQADDQVRTSAANRASGDTAATGAAAPPPGIKGKDAATWWHGLTEAQRQELINRDPALVGRMDGLPASARDAANRLLLNRDLAELGAREANGELTDLEKRVLDNAKAADVELHRTLLPDPQTHEAVPRQLLIYEPSLWGGDGRAAISFGDLDHARHVAVNVPGMNTDVGDDMDSTSSNANRLYYESRRAAPTDAVASVAWIGYDTPGKGVLGPNAAKHGTELLRADVQAIRDSRGDFTPQPHLTVIAHSYGSTTASFAAQQGLAADDLILLGSPGMGEAETVADLHMRKEQVWVGAASRDITTHAPLGAHAHLGLGADPAHESFGAQRFKAEATDRSPVLSWSDHSKHYDGGSESVFNESEIIVDHDGVQLAASRFNVGNVEVDPEYWRKPGKLHH